MHASRTDNEVSPSRGIDPCLTRRALVGAGALLSLAGCSGGHTADAGSASAAADPKRTVTVAMSPKASPLPVSTRSWPGAAASTCTSRSSNLPSWSPMTP